MISYNKTILNEIFDSFSNLVGANVSIFDDNYNYSPVANFGNKSRVCASMASYIKNRCKETDADAIKKCGATKKPFFYKCHLGFQEIIVPFYVNISTSFYVIIGPFKADNETVDVRNNISKYLNDDKDLPKNIFDYIDEIPVLTDKSFQSIVKIINVIIEDAIKNKYIVVTNNFVENKLNQYLEDNISKQIRVTDICAHFFYSAKQLDKVIREYSGLSPKKYILRYKINVSKKLLIHTDKSLQQIAQEVGFDDYNYFIKVFKSFIKDTPLHFRKKNSLKAF